MLKKYKVAFKQEQWERAMKMKMDGRVNMSYKL